MEYEHLYGAGYRYISFRPRSEKEIRDYLAKVLKRRHAIAPRLIDKVIQKLRELGYVDDGKFAKWWVDQRSSFKPKGKRLIAQELKQKGISYSFDIDEKALAIKAIAKKSFKDNKHAIDYLLRRGFPWEISSRVVDELLKNQ